MGLEPTGPYDMGPPIFKIGAIDLSAISPIVYKRTSANTRQIPLGPDLKRVEGYDPPERHAVARRMYPSTSILIGF